MWLDKISECVVIKNPNSIYNFMFEQRCICSDSLIHYCQCIVSKNSFLDYTFDKATLDSRAANQNAERNSKTFLSSSMKLDTNKLSIDACKG